MENLPELFGKTEMLSMETAKKEIRECSELSARYSLVLNEKEIGELVECRQEALKATGRVEFGGGIMPKLIRAFCDSPFITQSDYADTLSELQYAFYYFKTESEDRISDDELIEYMTAVFNGRAQGSCEYLSSLSVEALMRFADRPYDEADADEAEDLF